MASIYRKYRPKSFSEMVGQNHIKLTLQSELEQGSFVHAYLFCGPRGLGKTTAARLFAKALNCEKRKEGESEPCNECLSCKDIMASKSLDLLEIDAASHTGVDNVRENIIESTRFAPHKSKFKVFIIDEVHMLSTSAFNALLKTLEEPPAHVAFILCTTEIHKVPETIISRCQRFDFKKLPAQEQIKRLKRLAESEGTKLDDEVYSAIASKSEGCMRDAESMLGQVLSLGGKSISKEQAALVLPMSEAKLILEFSEILLRGNLSAGLDFVGRLVDDGISLPVFLKEFIEFLRKLILIKVEVDKAGLLGFDSQTEKQINSLLEFTTSGKLLQIMEFLLRANQDMKSSPIVSLPLEMCVMKVCGVESESGINVKKAPVFRNPAIKDEQAVVKEKPESIKTAVKKEGKQGETVNQLDFEKIKREWSKIVKTGHKKTRDLTFINEKMVWPVKISGGALDIGFKYDLHKSRFETNSNKQVFEEALKEVTGEDIKVTAKTLKPSELADLEIALASSEAKNENLSETKVTENNILENVLESFGGEVVE